MLLLPHSGLDERRAAAAGPLAPLADSLAAELEPLLRRELYVPAAKALLSRAGGRCEVDGSALDFDPWSPHHHRCPKCGRSWSGEQHHRWWVYFYQLWLAERAVHASLLHLLRGDARHARLAADILHRYAEVWASWPNRDNVLGPTRVFFSTYLESIWLLQLCIAGDLLHTAGASAAVEELRTRIVVPSAGLIAQYDEGMSNRQVWNNAALLAAALVLGDRVEAERVVRSPSGIEAHLRHGLLSDGTWYEGENYHLFAHRGLWYGMVMAEAAGIAIDPALVARFDAGFATPFATALPDFTLPSRKDSQYAISLQQVRFAELCELGLARQATAPASDLPARDAPNAPNAPNAILCAALARIYSSDVPAGDTGRARSTADVERNMAPSRLTRADLGWRSLLHARAELPALEGATPASALLEAQGIAVFRRERGHVYVALDYGQSGGGHGHPDRLNVLFAQDQARWLDDLGTGSYVDPSLHWYRSTLAHNAPLINGRSQARVDGTLLAYDERGGVGWVMAEADEIAPGVRVQRALVVTPDYFVDLITWTASEPVRFELPVHFDAEFSSPGAALARTEPREPRAPGESEASPATSERVDGGDGLEDGFTFVSEARAAAIASGSPVYLTNRTIQAWVRAESASRWFRAAAPGQPPETRRPFYIVRCAGSGGVIRAVWSWSPRIERVSFSDDRIDITLGAERHSHRLTSEDWQMKLTVGGAESGIELTGWRPRRAPVSSPDDGLRPGAAVAVRAPTLIRPGTELAFHLGEEHYRRSEESWEEAGRPAARVTLRAAGDELIIGVEVVTPAPVFVGASAVNPYDNEHADINGDGVQLYIATRADSGAWLLVPEPGRTTTRVRSLPGWGALELRRADWQRTAEGYELRAHIALPRESSEREYPLAIDLLVNETAPGRARRRGQLVLSGAQGEFVYLRGDRHDPGRLVPFVIRKT
jgi:hypothetical protein